MLKTKLSTGRKIVSSPALSADQLEEAFTEGEILLGEEEEQEAVIDHLEVLLG